MELKTAFQQLPENVKDLIRDYIDEGNSKTDLIDLFLNKLSVESIVDLVDEVQ